MTETWEKIFDTLYLLGFFYPKKYVSYRDKEISKFITAFKRVYVTHTLPYNEKFIVTLLFV